MKCTRKQAARAVFVLSLALILIASLVMLVQAAVPWTKQGVVSLKDDLLVDELFVEEAYVIKNSATDYEMWYTHGQTALSISDIASSLAAILTDDIVTNLANLDLDALLDALSVVDVDALWDFLSAVSTVIGYATSTDGIAWTVVNSAVLTGGGGAWDSVGSPSVVKTGPSSYEMWYTHTKTPLTNKTELGDILTGLGGDEMARKTAILALIDATTTVIGYTTSTDGIAWAAPNLEVLAGSSGGLWDSVGSPSVIRNSATDYEMWYTQSKTDVIEGDINTILANIANFNADALWGVIDGTGSVISYTTSTDGVNWAAPTEVLAGSSGGLWDSVGAPSVLNTGGSYEMWYTRGSTDLTSLSLGDLFDEIRALEPDISIVWASVRDEDIFQFLLDFQDLIDNNANMDNIKALLANTNTVIGYATSGDGITWDVRNPQALVGTNSSLWASVANPSVVWQDGLYEIWFTQGIDQLSSQNLLDVLQGDILPLGYANYPGVSIDLVSGWNFIGLAVSPIPPNTEDVLSGIIANVQTVWAYDAATATWSYYTTIVGPPPGGLTEMTAGKGYWIELINPATLTAPGVDPLFPYDIDLVIGWNLISIPETPSPSAIEDVLSVILTNVQTVWAYDAATTTWSYYTTIVGPPQGDLTDMTEGKAYWVEMTAPDTLTIN